MIASMPTAGRPQQRYDHRLRHLVQRTGDMTVATDRGVPRSTARGWLGAAPTVVVGLDVADLTEPELRQEVLKLRRRVHKLTALLRLTLALLRTSGFRLTGARLPDGCAKTRILRAVDRARVYLPLRAILRFLGVSPSRFHAWRRRQRACALEDQFSCPRVSPSRLTPTDAQLEAGHVQLRDDGPSGYLRSILDALAVPVESQMAVFVKDSVQARRISLTPRSTH
jgi:hypothetical protein